MESASVLIDPRVGSGDLLDPLRLLGVPARLEHLEYGDVQVVGRGPEDRPVLIGVEIKAIGDLLSSIATKRFSGRQLEGMLAAFEIPYLLIEGVISAAPSKELVVFRDGKWRRASGDWKHPWTLEQVYSFVQSMRRVGMNEVYTADRRGTATWISALWSNWSKAWNDHKSHFGLRLKDLSSDSASPFDMLEVTPKIRVAANITEGIGAEKSRVIAQHFRSIREMVNAGEEEWMKIHGVGRKLANRIVTEIVRES